MKRFGMMCLAILLCGCTTTTPRKPTVNMEFRPGEMSAAAGLVPMTAAGANRTVYLSPHAILTNADVESAKVSEGSFGPEIAIKFTKAGTAKFAEATGSLVGKPIGILIDGKLICSPIVHSQIPGGRAVISGQFTLEEAKRIAAGITGR